MKDAQMMEMMAMWADAEARSTATMIEMIVAAAVIQAAPPKGTEVTSITIGEENLADTLIGFHHEARYEDGKMTIFVTRLVDNPDD